MTRVVQEVQALAEARYVYPGVGTQVAQVLAAGLAEGRYPADERQLAEAVTADLQSVNGDKHLRLLYHDQPSGPRDPGDDAEEYAAVARWAQQTCGGVAGVERLAGNVGYLDLSPILFPAVIGGELADRRLPLAERQQQPVAHRVAQGPELFRRRDPGHLTVAVHAESVNYS